MNAFFRTNGYDEVYAQENYPRSEVVNHFGVPDAFLFSYALPVLRQRAAEGDPFMATLLTISNHPPYVVPDAFADPSLTPKNRLCATLTTASAVSCSKPRANPGTRTRFSSFWRPRQNGGHLQLRIARILQPHPLFIHGEGRHPAKYRILPDRWT